MENLVSPCSTRKWVNPSMRVAVVGDSSAVGAAERDGRGFWEWLVRLRVTTAASPAMDTSSPARIMRVVRGVTGPASSRGRRSADERFGIARDQDLLVGRDHEDARG